MSIRKGDWVKFLNEVGEGKVTRINNNVANVLIENGFEIPVAINELIKTESPEDIEDEAEKHEEPAPSRELELSDVDLTAEDNTSVNIAIGFIPAYSQNIAISDIEVYLINDSNYGIYYTLGGLDNGELEVYAHGVLEDNTKVHLVTLQQSKLSQIKDLQLQSVFFGKDRYKSKDPLSKIFDLSKINFYRAKEYGQNDYFNEDAVVLEADQPDLTEALKKLSEKEFAKVIREKESTSTDAERTAQKKDTNDPEEVDLHIHEIMDDYADLSNGEILDIQMSRFETALQTAVNSKTRRIVFIHGVGNGKLKYELRKKLDRKYPDLRYQDASFKEYGFGATMVILR
jgi:hypothetical protein